jgi:hypothetical protein
MKLCELRRRTKPALAPPAKSTLSPPGQKFPMKFMTSGQNTGQNGPLSAPVPPSSGAVGPTNAGGRIKGDQRKERFMGGELGT